MSRPIISVENVGKRYRLGVGVRTVTDRRFINQAFTLKHAISNLYQTTLQRVSQRGRARKPNWFWALQDVSFDVQRGEVIGIVGRNGAGKSTLLKILSRIVEPTRGTIRLRGRVASLLEVGTGFHPELTGRENIYLNGAILGMRKVEIDRKFDEIVAFAEVEKFLDTPVKRYSSGMYVRLAFAVAAHLEPEILIVDEVLAVGDYAFQKKCLGKMRDVASGGGRTVLFVSHNMGALTQLCQRAVLLNKGTVETVGTVDEVVTTYMRSGLSHNTAQARFPDDPSKPFQFLAAEIRHADGGLGSDFSCDEPVIVRLTFEVRKRIPGTFLTFYLQNLEGTRVLFSDIRDTDPALAERLTEGRHTFEITIPHRLLAPTTYLLTIGSANKYGGVFDHQNSCCEFTLRDLATQRENRPGVLGVHLPWDFLPRPASLPGEEWAKPVSAS
jgi:lipopolysaccharide transport system ATP-binding protein